MINDEKYRAHFFPTSPLLSPTLMRSQGACCTSREPEIFHLLAFSPPNALDLRSRNLQRYYSLSLVHNLIWSSFNLSHYQIVIFYLLLIQYFSVFVKLKQNYYKYWDDNAVHLHLLWQDLLCCGVHVGSGNARLLLQGKVAAHPDQEWFFRVAEIINSEVILVRFWYLQWWWQEWYLMIQC